MPLNDKGPPAVNTPGEGAYENPDGRHKIVN